MTSAATGLSVTSAPALSNATVPPIAAASVAAPSEPKSGVSPAVQASLPDPPENGTPKPAQIGVQISNALLGLSAAGTSNSVTAPDIAPPPAPSPTGYTEFAVNAAVASQAADNESTGYGSGNSPDSSASDSTASQDDASNAAAQSTASAAGSDKKPASAQGHIAFSPLPVIPQWHIRPKMKEI